MFKPTSAKDRLNYGDALIPPIGFRVEHAIGTTYSLDLETLTAISIALGLAEDTDSELVNNPISLLSALQKISDRIVVFCEAGQIKLPSKENALCLTLEKMVVPVSLPYDSRLGRYPAFHPKVWLIEYGNPAGSRMYRLIIMSRNMTFDHSWDVAYTMDGVTSAQRDAATRPLVEFLSFLKKNLNRELHNYDRQNSDLDYMIKAISRVSFYPDSDFSEFEIMPMGIGPAGYNMRSDPLLTENFHDLVIMSPFLSGRIIQGLNRPEKTLIGTKRTLITRRTELPKIKDGKSSRFDVYVMKDEVIDGEGSISDGEESQPAEEMNKQDIHAKVYIRRKNNTVDLYLGSMNASYSAINANTEMMIRLRTKNSVLDGAKFLDDIMGKDRNGSNPFEMVFPDNEQKEEETSAQDEVEKLIKRICRFHMTAKIEKNNDKYDLHLKVGIRESMSNVRIRPLRSNKDSELQPEIVFQSMRLLQLSEFYVITAEKEGCQLERVIMIPTEGMPEERDEEIIKNVITSKKQFIECIAFILGDDYIQSFLENKKYSGSYGEWGQGNGQAAVYEKMLRTAVTDPDRLGEIQYITRAVKEDEIIPPEFREMYRVFCETLGIRQE